MIKVIKLICSDRMWNTGSLHRPRHSRVGLRILVGLRVLVALRVFVVLGVMQGTGGLRALVFLRVLVGLWVLVAHRVLVGLRVLVGHRVLVSPKVRQVPGGIWGSRPLRTAGEGETPGTRLLTTLQSKSV